MKSVLAILTFLFAASCFSHDQSGEMQMGSEELKIDSELKGWDLSEAPEKARHPTPKVYPGAISFDLGPLIRSKSEDGTLSWLVGAYFRANSTTAGHLEGGLEIIGDRLGAIGLGYRYFFEQLDPVKPQVKLSLVSTLLEGQGVGGVFNLGNLHARLAIGLESDINSSLRFRIEGEGDFNTSLDLEIHLRLGIVWVFDSSPPFSRGSF